MQYVLSWNTESIVLYTDISNYIRSSKPELMVCLFRLRPSRFPRSSSKFGGSGSSTESGSRTSMEAFTRSN